MLARKQKSSIPSAPRRGISCVCFNYRLRGDRHPEFPNWFERSSCRSPTFQQVNAFISLLVCGKPLESLSLSIFPLHDRRITMGYFTGQVNSLLPSSACSSICATPEDCHNTNKTLYTRVNLLQHSRRLQQ